MAELIPYTTEQILDLFKAAYYEQTGETLRIGSDEFAFSRILVIGCRDVIKRRWSLHRNDGFSRGIGGIYG